MDVEHTSLPGVLLLRPQKHADERGFFSEVFKQSALREAGVDLDWVQDNHVLSTRRGVVRGLHFQAPPFAQAKLIRVVRGAIHDVTVDIRAGSPSYGAHVALELSADNWLQVLVPAGFAHGYCVLTDVAEVVYKVSAPYAAACEGGLLWNDPALGLGWPITASEAIVNARDAAWPGLRDLKSPFSYEAEEARA